MVGAGLLPFALGNDAAGSIRVPAALSGCFGLICSRSRIQSQGPSLSLTIGQNGWMTSCVRDAAILYALLADKGGAPVRVPALRPAGQGTPLPFTTFHGRSYLSRLHVTLGLRPYLSQALQAHCWLTRCTFAFHCYKSRLHRACTTATHGVCQVVLNLMAS